MHHVVVLRFVLVLTALAYAGGVGLVLGNVVGSMVVPDHDWISDTVSDLAAGRYEIIQDVTLYGYAAALIAVAIGAAHMHSGTREWSGMIYALLLLALCVTIIAARNEYGDGDSDGFVIHTYVVYVLGFLFACLFVLAMREARNLPGVLRPVSAVCAGLWIFGAPIFFFMPTGYDGIYERALGLITVAWVVVFAAHLARRAREIL